MPKRESLYHRYPDYRVDVEPNAGRVCARLNGSVIADSSATPFKGEASYWTFRCGDLAEENLAWSYEAPFDPVAQLQDFIAFYPDRVELSFEA